MDINHLIELYKNGKISEDDRYELEKKALDDPFLFDALEGFAKFSPEEGLKTEPKIIPMWLKAVAVAVFVGVVGIIGFQFLLNDQSDGSQMSMKEKPIIEEEKQTKQSEKAVALEDSEKIDDRENQPPEVDQKEQKIEPVEKRTKTKNQLSLGQDQVQTIQTPQARSTDLSEERAEVANEQLTESTLENRPKLDLTSKNTGNKLTLSKPLSKGIDVHNQSIPMVGESAFRSFVDNQIKERNLNQSPTQEIIIDFMIDQNGNLSEFKARENNCPECAAFAISMLQQSGIWRNPNSKDSSSGYYIFTF